MLSILISIWCFPGTLLGFLLAAFSTGSDAKDVGGSIHCIVDGGLALWFFETFGFAAITLGEVVHYRSRKDYERCLEHELRHVLQWRILGPLFPLVYLAGWAWAGFSYSDNFLEQDARNHE